MIENQLRLLVGCYKHMCLVLADHMSKSLSGQDKSTKLPGSEKEGKPNADDFDPIAELLKEVQEGTKVSRAVLIVRPPEKYLKPPSSSTPRKDYSSKSSLSTSLAHSSTAATLTSASGSQKVASKLPDEGISMEVKSHLKGRKGESKKKQHVTGDQSMQQPSSDTEPMQRDCGSSNSEEELVGVGSSEKQSKKKSFSPISAQTGDLEVSASCFNLEYVTVTTSTIEVKGGTPQLMEIDQPNSSSLETGSSSLPLPERMMEKFGRSLSPLSPRVVLRRRRIDPARVCPLKTVTIDSSEPGASHRLVKEARRTPAKLTAQGGAEKTFDLVDGSSEEESTMEVSYLEGEMVKSPVLPTPTKKRKLKNPNVPCCRCGTNNPQFLEKICARSKCPCFIKQLPCRKCHCRHCHNPFQ